MAKTRYSTAEKNGVTYHLKHIGLTCAGIWRIDKCGNAINVFRDPAPMPIRRYSEEELMFCVVAAIAIPAWIAILLFNL